MAKKIDGYTLLLNRGSRGSLWLGDDHLLVIETSCFMLCVKETYRRFDFANIQSLLQAQTKRNVWQMVLLVLMFCLFGWLTYMVPWDSGGYQFFKILMVVITLFFLALMVVHVIKGPSAALVLQTAVKSWRLGMITRAKQAEVIIQALGPLCQEAQQAIKVEPDAPVTSAPKAAPTPLADKPSESEVSIHPFAAPAWICLVAFAAMIAGEMVWNQVPATLLMMGFGSAAFILLLICFGRGGGTAAVGGRRLFICAMVALGVDVVTGYIVAMTHNITHVLRHSDSVRGAPMQQSYLLEGLARFPENQSGVLFVVVFVLAAFTAGIGIVGLLSIERQKRYKRQAAASTDDGLL